MGAYGGGGPAYGGSMSQGGVPGGGVVKLRRQIPSVEVKFYDQQWGMNCGANTWTLGSAVPLAGILQGTGPSERVGRKIKVCGIIIRGTCTLPQASPWTVDVVVDKQCNGVAATAAQVYANPLDFTSFPNPFEETRFRFLKRFQSFNPAQATPVPGGAPVEQAISLAIKTNFTVEYNASTGAVTDLTSDNLMIFNCSPQPMTNLNRCLIRILYTDA